MTELRITSCQAPIADAIGRALAEVLRDRLGMAVTWVDDVDWRERYAQMEEGRIHLGWICGAPYVRLRERGVAVELVAAPIYRGARYADRPVYFSDVLVRAESPYRRFEDLRGLRWAFNERGSLSGYECVRGELWRRGALHDYFGAVIEAGSHQNALVLLRQGSVDAAAIDTTVLDEVARLDPDALSGLRALHTIGPWPMPPWVVAPGVDAGLHERIAHVMTTLHEGADGRAMLAKTLVARFAAVEDRAYDPVRELLTHTAAVEL